jgi:hypothetical protein
MRYVMAQYETSFQSMTYRIFVTDYLKGIGRFDGRRYIETITDIHKPIETRTSDEIITDIKGKISQLGGE